MACAVKKPRRVIPNRLTVNPLVYNEKTPTLQKERKMETRIFLTGDYDDFIMLSLLLVYFKDFLDVG